MWHLLLAGLGVIWIATIVGVVLLAVRYYVKERCGEDAPQTGELRSGADDQ